MNVLEQCTLGVNQYRFTSLIDFNDILIILIVNVLLYHISMQLIDSQLGSETHFSDFIG